MFFITRKRVLRMKKTLLVCMLAVLATATFAQTKRALFIGINTYKPDNAKSSPDREAPPNLAGCVNDALAMKEIMQIRYGFEEKNITTLFNQDASRAGIIKEIEKLIEVSKKGDVVFIFYAGHGSQVKNSLSVEADKMDETIVPADAYKGEKDIRDKELAVLLNKLVDKGVIVTAIFDSCHSGSLSRTGNAPKYRFTSGDNRDVKDPEQPEPPENRGALIISAARDKEPAQEIKDQHGMPHGGFTVALLEILRTESPSASVNKIFRRVEAVMLYNNLAQKAVLAGNENRRTGNLIGISDSLVSDVYEVPVITMEGDQVVLNAGFATGISTGTILKKLTEKGFVVLEVVRVESINKSYAKIKETPQVSIKPGDGFKIENLVLSPEAAIKIYVFNSNYTTAKLASTVKNLAAAGYNFSELPATVPYQSVYCDNSKWQVAFKDKKTAEIGADVSKEKLAAKIKKDSTSAFIIPATQNLGKLLKDRFTAAGTVRIVNNPADADYHLVGRWKDGKIEYAFINPDRMFGDPGNENPLPARTNYFAVSDVQGSETALADSLQEYIMRIAKVKSWLTLPSPPDDGSFPFSFALRHSRTNELIHNGGQVKYGDTLGLVFTMDEANEIYWDKNKRHVYAFSIDKYGKMMLIFPRTITAENVYPIVDRNTYGVIQNAHMGGKMAFKITDSVGTLNYLMLTTSEPINDLEIFKQEGVYKEEGTRCFPCYLEKMLAGLNAGTRNELIAPANWSIERISVKCVPRN